MTAVRKGAFDFFCYEDLNPANLSRSVLGAMKTRTVVKAVGRRTA